MAETLAQTINRLTRQHLENGGLLLGQTIAAVGWVNNTVPDCQNIVELPMCDVAGAGIAVGAAIAGRRPIFIWRYQDFATLGMSPIVNYAAKSKEMFGKGCPMLIRLIADEGNGLGPVHSGKLHSLFLHFPGVKVYAPVTPYEYESLWADFMADDVPYIVSEHRASYKQTKRLTRELSNCPHITLYGVSIARFNIRLARDILEREQIFCNIVDVSVLKPLVLSTRSLIESAKGLVVDTGFQCAGAAESIAYNLTIRTGLPVRVLGLEDKSCGCSEDTENMTPSVDKIVETVREMVRV